MLRFVSNLQGGMDRNFENIKDIASKLDESARETREMDEKSRVALSRVGKSLTEISGRVDEKANEGHGSSGLNMGTSQRKGV